MARTPLQLLPLAQVLLLCRAFNIDTESPTRFEGDGKGHFGYKVVQVKTDNASWVVVSAPLSEGISGQHTGALYRCSYVWESCEPVPVNNTAPISLGLTLNTDDTSSTGLIACGPTFSRQCEQNSFLNGICFLFDKDFRLRQELQPSYQECISGVDAVILYDDSLSISAGDFRRMKDFMVTIIRSLKGFNIMFAVVQYSTDINTVFDFTYYQHVGDLKRLEDFPHTKGNTYTPSAIKYVTDVLFTEQSGARKNTKRLLITITDGASNDKTTSFQQATEAAVQKQITRYAIGVGAAFTSATARQELDTIASSKENVFQVDSFSALASIQTAVAQKIFPIEGTQQASNVSSFQRELSQGGFSAVMTQDTIALGTVGAYDWSGGLEEIHGNTSTFINASSRDNSMTDSYLGYSVTLARSGTDLLYVVGAPRYRHVGRVVIFGRDSDKGVWSARQYLEGQQVGSYFGAELTSLDLDGDGETDLLLIGVPLYHAQGIGGTVRVCQLARGENFTCTGTLRGTVATTLGRFGAALSPVGDLNWDGLADVAVGAPLEDDHRGAVYIFHGRKEMGLGPRPSQRISGAAFSPGLMYFGVSIYGRLDLSGDGLTDIAVGSLGQALVLRSRPVITTSAYMTFDPPRIPLDHVECSRRTHDPSLPVVNVNICFAISRVSRDRLGDISTRINYSLLVDTGRRVVEQTRLVMKGATEGFLRASTMENCVQRMIHAPVCISDFLSPVKMMMNFSVDGDPIAAARNLRPILDPASNTSLQTEVLFETKCGSDDVCTADLKASFDDLGTQALVAVPGFLFNITVLLENAGELAYKPRLTIRYPMGLAFRQASTRQSLRRASLMCDMTGIARNQSEKSIACIVSPSVLRENTQVAFSISFQVLEEDSWGERTNVTVQADSDNENETLHDNTDTRDIPVLHGTNVIVKALESISYLNFSAKEPEVRHLSHAYQVQNHGRRAVPMNVTVHLPLRLESGFQWDIASNFTVKGENTTCVDFGDMGLTNTGTVSDDEWAKSHVLSARVIACHIATLSQDGAVSFHFEGPFYVSSEAQLSAQKLSIRSNAWITTDRMRFYVNPEEQFHQAQVTTEVEVISAVNVLPIVIGSSIAGLVLLAVLVAILYRVGFFKRRSKMEANTGSSQVELELNQSSPDQAGDQGEMSEPVPSVASDTPNPRKCDAHEETGSETPEAISKPPDCVEANDQEGNGQGLNKPSEIPEKHEDQDESSQQTPEAEPDLPTTVEATV